MAGKNRHVGNSRLFARHRSVGLEEAGQEEAGNCLLAEEDNHWVRWETQNSYLWIAGPGEADSDCCRLDVGPG